MIGSSVAGIWQVGRGGEMGMGSSFMHSIGKAALTSLVSATVPKGRSPDDKNHPKETRGSGAPVVTVPANAQSSRLVRRSDLQQVEYSPPLRRAPIHLSGSRGVVAHIDVRPWNRCCSSQNTATHESNNYAGTEVCATYQNEPQFAAAGVY